MREPTTPASDEAGEKQPPKVANVPFEEAQEAQSLIASRHWDVELVFRDYLEARADGISHEDLISAMENGIADLGTYARARRAGATHDEILHAHNNGYEWGLFYYADFREAGATHPEAIEAKGIVDYGELRNAGANHAEALYVHKLAQAADSALKIVDAYIRARKAGATHAEIVEAVDKGLDLTSYSEAREVGIDHHLALQVHALGVLRQLIIGTRWENRS